MIEVNKQKIGKTTHEVFTLLNDGFVPSGWVQLDCRLSDMKSEGEAFLISVSDQNVAKNGDYAPLEMNKAELKTFIEYLSRCYNAMQ